MSLQEKIREFVVENFYVPDGMTVSDETSLIAGGIVDSTGVLEIVDFIEDRFGVRVPDQEMLPENLDSVARIARMVEEKLALRPLTPVMT